MLLDLRSLYEETVVQPGENVYIPSGGGSSMQWGEIERRMREKKEEFSLYAHVHVDAVTESATLRDVRVSGAAQVGVRRLSERDSLSSVLALGVGKSFAPRVHVCTDLLAAKPRGVAWTRMSLLSALDDLSGVRVSGVGRGVALPLDLDVRVREVDVLVGEDLVLRDDEEVLSVFLGV